MIRLALAAAPLALASCVAPLPPVLTPAPDTCNASAYQYLLGQDPAAANVLPQPKRVFHITDAVTMDHVEERLNVQIDDSGTIGAITCG